MTGTSADPRIGEYARLLVERCVGVRSRWQVIVRAQPAARPLVEEVMRLIAHKGAYALLRMSWALYPWDEAWAAEAPLELAGELAPIDRYTAEHMDARISIEAPEDTTARAELPPQRLALASRVYGAFSKRTRSGAIPWVECVFPTEALARDAGIPLADFEELVYGACLRDWDAESRSMQQLVERFDAANEVRIVGEETDLTLSLRGRKGEIDRGYLNMPGGEFFFSPLEDSADGTIYFDIPALLDGVALSGVRLTFRRGRVEEASAEDGEAALLAALESDAGARFIGEFGVGCNKGIARPIRNVLFDEKIAGTVHVAIGNSYPSTGGTNVSDLHWDFIKDLRRGGRIELDGESVQQDGRWLDEGLDCADRRCCR